VSSTKSSLQFVMIVIFSCIGISSCMVGPNFHSPASPQVQRYTEKSLPAKTVRTTAAGKAGKAQTFISGKDIPGEWWTLFHSQQLNNLITAGIANSPNLTAAYASLRQAQEAVKVQIGNSLLPAVDGIFNAQRLRYSEAAIGGNSAGSLLFNLFNANVSVTYTLDVFGGQRRQIESLLAQVDYQQFELIAAYLSLTSNIVTTTVNIASLEAQIKATQDLLKAEANQLDILRQQFNLGGVARSVVLTQETLVDQTRATLPALEKSLSQSRHALSALVGAFPDGQLPRVTLDQLNLPATLPVSLPSRLVRQRPDVRASEALLHSASAQIGVATANIFPQFNITNSYYGWEATIPSQLFKPSTKVWSIFGQLTQPLFHGGALLAQRREAIDAYDVAAAQYKQAVLTAFQNVADALRAIETDARALRDQKQAEVAARNNLNMSREQFKLGGVSYLVLLNAQQQYQTVRLNRIQAQAARFADTAALFQALGGGWWNKKWCVNECV
jgi:NodT family efflux transporter outer membrane factor (OMF) lipoprotein